MNDEINIMIELQHYWDLVLAHSADSERCRKSIKTWESRLKELQQQFQKQESLLKNLKLKTKQAELNLEDYDSRIVKIEQRKDNLKSEREIEAQNNELSRLKNERSSIENEILDFFEQIENLECEVDKLKKELTETSEQTEKDLNELNNKIKLNDDQGINYKNLFNAKIDNLSASNKARFSKLINSKDGQAIAKLNGEICSHCNFQVPSSIAQAVIKREAIYTCTNCGRFIY